LTSDGGIAARGTDAAQRGRRFERYQAALRIANYRDDAEEDADFGVAADDSLREEYAGLTPTTIPGVR